MMRYRSEKIVPGAKPPTGTESEEISPGGTGDKAGAAPACVVICESEAMAFPQLEQKRLSVEMGAEQNGH
jgi:hypothetical protein